MGVIKFQKPDKVYMVESTETRGKFEFCPLEPGYGLTVGNALRRVLLSSLEGYAIAAVKIEGVEHEFSTIDGVIEDVTDIVLNLKKIRFKKLNENAEWDNIHLSISGKNTLTAGEINKVTNDFLVLNPDEVICNMDKKVKMDITLTLAKGRGFVVSENHDLGEFPLGTILTDSIFTPIKNVKYGVENFRVGQKTDYEKLVFEIDTDGSILPKDALTEAAKILIHHFMLFSDDRITMEDAQEDIVDEYDEESLHMRQLLKTKLVDLELSVRALNCLKAAEIDTLGELVQINKSDLMKFRNFGKKSLTELEQFIESKGLVFGMDVSAYKLDKE